MTKRDGSSVIAVTPGLLLAGLLAFASPVSVVAQEAEADVTYASDVATIIQQNCQTCHRPGSVAPMSLLTYQDARRWASRIRDQVSRRIMPPWPLDTGVGIQAFKNDRSLSQEEINTIVAWVDQGAPMGNEADLPPAIEWPAWGEHWAYEEYFNRPPDVIVTSPAYTVSADGMDQWPSLAPVEITRELGVTGERWIRAVELRPATPGSAKVFHHGSARVANRAPEDVYIGPGSPQSPPEVRDTQRDQLAEAAVGVEGTIYPEGTGRLLKEGDLVVFNPHFYPGGITEDLPGAALQVGVWLYPEGVIPRPTDGDIVYDQTSMPGMEDTPLIVPPHGQAIYRTAFRLEGNAQIHSLRGHMHLLGAYNILEVVYPDGRYELINKLNWDQRWHTAFLYEDDARPLLPKGTTVMITTVFDNTTNNHNGLDPDQWVVGGSRTADEMFRLRVGTTFYSDEDFAELVAERARRPVAQR
jgi:mono/diheme cytochrome c family protein